MSISLITAIEIYSNPYDLEFLVGKEKGGTKFAIAITRGPGHNYKLLLTTEPYTENQAEVIGRIREILERVRSVAENELNNPESIAASFLNPDGEEINQANVLNADLIERIIAKLEQDRVASTCEMVAT